MDSKSLENYAFGKWYHLEKLTVPDLPHEQESTSGVYVFRLKKIIPEVHDLDSNSKLVKKRVVSDILYIGKTDELTRRIFGNYIGDAPTGAATTHRIHLLLLHLGYIEKVEVGWTVTRNHDELEKELIGKFKQEHGEKPPWNHQ